MDIHSIAQEQKEALKQKGISLIEELEDLDRPWGGFLVVDPADTKTFIAEFFSDAKFSFNPKLDLQPKILMVLAEQRLSWQYHHRRAEYWRAVDASVGYYKSENDEMGDLQILEPGEFIKLDVQERHRLVGLGEVGIVAEIWQHTDPDQPSTEADIVRVEDDYSRHS